MGNDLLTTHSTTRATRATAWIARVLVCLVFIVNVDCAVKFLVTPELYVSGFELSGIEGKTAVQGLGVAFLMWNATYPLVIVSPRRYSALFIVILAQQSIGLIGETFLLLNLPTGYESIATTITRFVLFDAIGLAVMVAAFMLLRRAEKRNDSR